MAPLAATDRTCVEAYDLYCRGWTYDQIAAQMKDPPHNCGGRTTAFDWVKRGEAIEAEFGGPMSKRRAQRRMIAREYNRHRVKMEQEVEAGLWNDPAIAGGRHNFYKLQFQALRDLAKLQGANASAAVTRVQVDGAPMQALDPVVARALAALSPDELLPDGED